MITRNDNYIIVYIFRFRKKQDLDQTIRKISVNSCLHLYDVNDVDYTLATEMLATKNEDDDRSNAVKIAASKYNDAV